MVILQHTLMTDLVLWMRSGAASGGSRTGARSFAPTASVDVSEADAERLREVGVQLFSATFVLHKGYLPVKGSDECPWDDGALDLALLAHVPTIEDALQLARQVLLRCLWKGVASGRAGVDSVHPHDVETITRLWSFGRWPRCQDVDLISQAMAFLSACWREVSGLPGLGDLPGDLPKSTAQAEEVSLCGKALVGSSSRRLTEELLFKMFTDLEVWRLPSKDLLTPWVPGQVLACHVAAQCRQLEDRQATLLEETRMNLEEISRLHTTISQLTARLEATDARSQQCMQKQADLNDTLRQLR